MALIERFTPGGNLYPDGSSTFAVLVQFFRRQAETRDARDRDLLTTATAAALANAEAAASSALQVAYQDATNKANQAEASATATASNDASAKAAAARDEAIATAREYTDTSFTASGPGGATDAQVDAAIERAVLAQRIGSVTLTQVAVGVYEITTV